MEGGGGFRTPRGWSGGGGGGAGLVVCREEEGGALHA